MLVPLLISIAGCNGGGGSDSGNPPTAAATFTGNIIDSPVANISYVTRPSGHSGTTNANGEYTYEDGDFVTFSIGNMELATVSAAEIITPMTLVSVASITDQGALNIARLLQSLDEDGDPNNGITIPANAAAVAPAGGIDFSADVATFESNPLVTNFVANSGSVNTALVPEADAQTHVTDSLFNLAGTIAGTWQSDSGDSKFILRADNTFTYIENVPLLPAPANGVESGAYTFDSGTGDITFDISSDTNDPGNNSGLGDIGTPAVFNTPFINGSNELVLAGGAITLNRTNQIVGAWSSVNGEAFNYLVLMADGKFLYAENDLNATDPGENGVEIGTYSYNPVTEDITFNISYDDNNPGTGSGVGDIGTPAVIHAALSNGNNTLTLAGGALTLDSVDFVSNSELTGVWTASNGTAFNYLMMIPDGNNQATGTFLYAENDPAATNPDENGLEVGTYSYISGSGNISFDLTYDDNGANIGQSGVGDIGVTSVIDSSTANNNHTLFLAGGTLTLTKTL